MVLVSTRTSHEEPLTLGDDDSDGDPLGDRSHGLPWSLATLNSAADADHYLPSLVDDRPEDVASQVIDYLALCTDLAAATRHETNIVWRLTLSLTRN